jgi:hypothetical protein
MACQRKRGETSERLTTKKKDTLVRLWGEEHDEAAGKGKAHRKHAECGAVPEVVGQVHKDKLASQVDDTEGHVEEQGDARAEAE